MRPSTLTAPAVPMLLFAVVLLLGAPTMAPASPEERCQANLYFAAGNYARCQQKAAAK